MTKYREIIRLNSLGFSGRNIALTCNVSRNTVSKVLKQASEQNLSWPLDESLTEQKLEELLFKLYLEKFLLSTIIFAFKFVIQAPVYFTA